ncbi:MAG: hypothetical protein J6K72_07385 [Clostridia bacterium]|nr:hypothetical protein [Clostridia bacterium]
MRIGKRSLIMVLSMTLAMTLSVFGTMAYLTSTASATNTFTVGNVLIDLDETAVDPEGHPKYDLNGDNTPDISVDEEGNVTVLPESTVNKDQIPPKVEIDENGNLVPEQGEPIPPSRNKGNQYNLVPGKEFLKDPTVTVKDGSEESYVRMVVTITNAAAVKKALGCEAGDVLGVIVPDLNLTDWPLSGIVEDTTADTITYEFRYFETVNGKDGEKVLPALFETFQVPVDVDNEGLEAFQGMQMKVEGHAIQSAALADEKAAWAAFDGQMN